MHKLWNRRFVHVLCIEIMLQMGYYLQNPLVSNYAVFLGATVAVAGFLSGLNALTSLFMRPVSGFASDRFSKKSLLVMASALYVVCSFGCALATSVESVGFFRVLFGVAFAFKSVVAVALVSLVVSPEVIGRAVGWYGAAHTVTNALGPVVGAAIAAATGYSAAFVAAGCMQVVGLILAVAFRAPDSAKAQHERSSCSSSNLEVKDSAALLGQGSKGSGLFGGLRKLFYFPALPCSIVAGLSSMAFGSVGALILLVGDMRGIDGVSLYFTAFAVVTVLSKPVAGRVSDRKGTGAVVIPMEAVGAFGMVVLAFGSGLPSILLGGVCMGLGHGSAFSALQAESVRDVPVEKVGNAANTFFVGSDIGMWAGPFVSALVLQAFGAEAMFLFNALCFLCALSVFLVARKFAWV